MAGTISVQEAVRQAKDALGNVPSQEMAAWIATNLGMTVKPVIVTAILGSFLEREHVERMRRTALEMVEKAKAEQSAEKPKGRRKTKASPEQAGLDAGAGQNDYRLSASALQGHLEISEEQRGQKPTAARGCPICNSGDYVFRGRKKIAPNPGEERVILETRHCCRACGHQWKVQAATTD